MPTGTPTSVRQDPELTGSLTGHHTQSPLGQAHDDDDDDDDEMFRRTDHETRFMNLNGVRCALSRLDKRMYGMIWGRV